MNDKINKDESQHLNKNVDPLTKTKKTAHKSEYNYECTSCCSKHAPAIGIFITFILFGLCFLFISDCERTNAKALNKVHPTQKVELDDGKIMLYEGSCGCKCQ